MPCRAVDAENMNGRLCSAEWLREQLEGDEGVILLDCRLQNDDNMSHISGALHVAIPTLMLRRLKKGALSVASVISGDDAKTQFANKSKQDTIVVYDDYTSDIADNPSSVVCLLVKKLHEDGCRVHLLSGGFVRFQDAYPGLCTRNDDCSLADHTACIFGLRQLRLSGGDEGCNTEEPPCSGKEGEVSPATPFPVEVLANLFLGNAQIAADFECLYKNNIRYIVNVTPNIENVFTHDVRFHYLRIPINDHWSQNLASFFPQAISFIDEAREKQCGVLVHCLAGISRSVTVTVAYLMQHLSLSLNDAYDYVKRCKPNISPNFNFMGQLLDFESALAASQHECSCDEHGPCSVCTNAAKTAYFTSPATCKIVSASPSLSASTASSAASSTSSATSGSEFQYDIPPTPS